MTGFQVFITVTALSAVTLLFPLICVLYGVGKKRKALRPVEYYPPRGYSPIDVMLCYYGKKCTPRELFNPLMLYWAQKGYITIEEDCKRGLKLTKIKDISASSDSPAHALELDLFNDIFYKRDVFYTLTASDADGKDLDAFMKKVERRAENQVYTLSKRLAFLSAVVAFVSLLASSIVFITSIGVISILLLFPIIGIIALWRMFSPSGKYVMEKRYRILFVLFFCCWSGIPFLALVFAGNEIGTDIMLSILFAFSSALINIFFISKKIDIRSDDNLKFYGEIDAFKSFLVDAELDKLETLIEDDPDYFYDILPYCYILKITEKLKPKFDRIALDGPSWYLGDLRETLIF